MKKFIFAITLLSIALVAVLLWRCKSNNTGHDVEAFPILNRYGEVEKMIVCVSVPSGSDIAGRLEVDRVTQTYDSEVFLLDYKKLKESKLSMQLQFDPLPTEPKNLDYSLVYKMDGEEHLLKKSAPKK